MSNREKKLLTFLLVALAVVVALFGYKWITAKKAALRAEIERHELTLDVAAAAEEARGQIAEEEQWLENHLPEPKEAELAPSALQTFVTTEANRAGLTVKSVRILENNHDGVYFVRARFLISVTGREASLWRWLVSLHNPNEFRAVTTLLLSPNREDDTLIDAEVQVEEWFEPKVEGETATARNSES